MKERFLSEFSISLQKVSNWTESGQEVIAEQVMHCLLAWPFFLISHLFHVTGNSKVNAPKLASVLELLFGLRKFKWVIA